MFDLVINASNGEGGIFLLCWDDHVSLHFGGDVFGLKKTLFEDGDFFANFRLLQPIFFCNFVGAQTHFECRMFLVPEQ